MFLVLVLVVTCLSEMARSEVAEPLLYEGDIVMTRDILDAILRDPGVPLREKRQLKKRWRKQEGRRQEGGRTKRAALKSETRLWGEGTLQSFGEDGEVAYAVIPYTLDSTVGSWVRRKIEGAIAHWENRTRAEGETEWCVKFVPWEGDQSSDYLEFNYGRSSSQGCWSKVGKAYGDGAQKVALGPQCAAEGLIIHELGHALGFFHEQSRADRDQWVKVLRRNVAPGKLYNFVKYDSWLVDSRTVDYDYGSIMHYSLSAFSRNGADTLRPLKDLPPGTQIGQRLGTSDLDVEQIRLMYGCGGSKVKEVEVTEEPEVEELVVDGSWSWDFRKKEWIWTARG